MCLALVSGGQVCVKRGLSAGRATLLFQRPEDDGDRTEVPPNLQPPSIPHQLSFMQSLVLLMQKKQCEPLAFIKDETCLGREAAFEFEPIQRALWENIELR